MQFTKIHSCGADYLFVDCVSEQVTDSISDIARKVCARATGIGALGLVLLLYSNDADYRIEIYNPLGEKVPADPDILCCSAAFASDIFANVGKTVSFDTDYGVKYVVANDDGSFTVNAGIPVVTPQLIPVDCTDEDFIDRTVIAGNCEFNVTSVSVGNRPFAVIFTKDSEELYNLDIYEYAPLIEKHNIFPSGTNVVFVNKDGSDLLGIRCWVAGEGEACGFSNASCAAFVAARLNGLDRESVNVKSLGGDMKAEISDDGFLYVTSFAEVIFKTEC